MTRRLPRALTHVGVAVLLVALLGQGSPATGGTLDAPTTPILDSFNGRGAEDPLDQWGNWAPASIDGQGQTMEALGATAGHNEGGGAVADSYREAAVAGDAEVYATLAGLPDNNAPTYLYLHLGDVGGAGWDGYRLRLERWVSSTPDTVAIQKISNGGATDLAATALAVDFAAGQVFVLRRTGAVLTAWRRDGGIWSQLLSATDGEYQSGRIGFGSDDDTVRWDDFGGSGASTPGPPPLTDPVTPVVDHFNRANEDPLSQGGAWAPTPIAGSGHTMEVISQLAAHNEGFFVAGDSYRLGDMTGDAEVHAMVPAVGEFNAPQYLYLHLGDVGTPGYDGYRLRLERWIGNSNDSVAIQKVVDGQATWLIAGGLAPDLQAGDVFLLRRLGNSLEVFRKVAGTWSRLLGTVDPAFSHGLLGLGCDDPDCYWDDFGGGEIGASSPTRLIVIKRMINNNGGTAVSSSWTMNVAGPTPLSFPGADAPGTTNDVQPGAYTVTESGGPAGYMLFYSGDCDADRDVTVAPGETKTCILANDDGGPAAGAPPPEQTFGAGENGTGIHGHSGSGLFADPVNSRTGAFTTSVDDLDLPATGVSFAWSRIYTSADPTVGRLGPGWTDSYSASLAVQPNGDVLLHGEDGQQVLYVRQPNDSFVGAPGSLSTLSSVTGGYELVRTDQVTYRFDNQGQLVSMKDRNEQGVTLTHDGQGRLTGVTDAANRQATISYNADQLVSQVRTQDGRSVAYTYIGGRLTGVTDVRGKSWTYTYDGAGRLEKIADPLDHAQVTNVYGADGRVQSQTDALDKTTTFAWDAGTETATATDANQNAWTHDYENGVLAAEMDPLTNETALVRDADLNTTSVTGPTSETTTMTYDAAGNMLTATAPLSLGHARKTFVYNARNDVELVTDARDKVTDYTYHATTGNLTSVTQDGVQVASYTYEAAGRVETFTDGNEKTSTYTYLPASGYLQSSTDPLGNKTTYTYDAAGRLATRVDPKGNVAGCNCAGDFTWSYTYDAAGQLLTERNPLGHTTTNVYDDAGRLTSTTDALGRVTSYTYDAANRVLTETAPDPDGAGPLIAPVTTYTYDDVGNKLTETDPRGNATIFAYSSANQLISETGPDPDFGGQQVAPVTTHTYDPNGNLSSTVEPRGNVSGVNPGEFRTNFRHDAAGRLLSELRPDPDEGPEIAQYTAYEYDPVGNLRSVQDGNDHMTTYTHDAAGRILTVTAPDGGVTTYTYDDAGNLLTRRDDNNHTTTYAHDAAGRLVSETSPDPDGPGPQGPGVTSFTYDANGNRLSVTDPNGNATQTPGDGVTTYGYDRANRQTSIDYSDSTPDVTFTYDAAGNRLSMTDGSGTETRTYDSLDRLRTVTRGANTFSYAYDTASNVTRRTSPGSAAVDYTYDALGRLAAVIEGSDTTNYTYDAASNLVQTTLPAGNGFIESRVYDRAGRLREVKSQKGATVLSQFVSTLDPVGNPVRVVRTGALAETQTYTYDAADRLTGVCFQAGTCPGASDPFTRWTYDKVGNRLSEQRPTGTTAHTYDARDRLLAAGPTSFAYDQNGNQTQKGTRTFTYDLANRMRSTTLGSATTTYSYDGEGKRVEANGGGGSSGAPTLRTPCSTATGASSNATVGKPAGTVAGDLLVVGLAFEKGSAVAITPPSGWMLIRRTNQSTDVGNATYRKTAGASEGTSYSFGLTNSPKWSIGACAIVGANTASPADVHNGASGASGNPSAPALTTTGPNRLVLAFYSNKKAATFSSYTSPAAERFDAPNGAGGLPSNAMASYELAAAGATGAKSAVASEQEKWVAQQVAIAPAPATGAGVIRFLWDTSFGLPQLALERDGTNALLRRYTYGERRISLTAASGTSYYLYDQLGSVANLTSSSGATQWTYGYEPFGTTRTETPAGTPPVNFMKFTGEYFDPTGLYHLRARQYDPSMARFLSLDPIPRLGIHVSLYAYALSRPLMFRDPSGAIFERIHDGRDAAAEPTSQARLLEPPLTQLWRMPCAARPGHPLGRIGRLLGRPHQGTHTRGNWQSDRAVDISVPVGTTVCAIFAGRVGTRIGPLGSSDPALAGLRLTIIGRTDQAYYAHLSRIWVRANDVVKKGQLLGLSGSAGAPHLHLALHYGDPMRYCRGARLLDPC